MLPKTKKFQEDFLFNMIVHFGLTLNQSISSVLGKGFHLHISMNHMLDQNIETGERR